MLLLEALSHTLTVPISTRKDGRFTFVAFGEIMPLALPAFRVRISMNIKTTQLMKTNGNVRLTTPTTESSRLRSLVDTQEVIYNIAQLAQVLNVTPNTIRKRIRRGIIPAHREGRYYYILKSEYVNALRNK